MLLMSPCLSALTNINYLYRHTSTSSIKTTNSNRCIQTKDESSLWLFMQRTFLSFFAGLYIYIHVCSCVCCQGLPKTDILQNINSYCNQIFPPTTVPCPFFFFLCLCITGHHIHTSHDIILFRIISVPWIHGRGGERSSGY